MAFFLFAACSEEENLPPPRQKQKVVRPAGIPVVERQKLASLPDEKKEASQEQTKEVKEEGLEKRPPETAERPEGKTAALGYLVKEGDSLSSVAGQADGYKDPLKWIILLRSNLETLDRWPETANFAEKKLPAGIRLKIGWPNQVSGKEADTLWAANVMSARSHEEIVPLAVRLARGGFPVYMTRTQVKGQEWTRLRVGFFASRPEAQEAGRKIKETFRVEEPWVLKVNKEEHEEFAGLLKRDSDS